MAGESRSDPHGRTSCGPPLGSYDRSAVGASNSIARDDRQPRNATRKRPWPSQNLDRLVRAEGRDAQRLNLQLMMPRHQGGVAMAEEAPTRAEEPQVRRLAQSIVDSQTSEIAVLRSMLAARGGPADGS